MSSNLIQAIDNTELAQQDIRQAIEDMALDGASITDIATAIREHNTAAITNAILGINPCCPSQYSQIVTALNNINTNLAALVAKPCCPQAVWDCSTETIQWVWPPKYPGGTAPAPEPPGGVIIYDPDYDPPPTFTDEDPRYGEPDTPTSFPDDGVVLGTTDERCKKANVFVYMMHEELGRYSDALEQADAFANIGVTIAGGGLAKIGTFFTSKTLGVVERFISLKDILSIADMIGGVWGGLGGSWLDLTVGFDDAISDLVCAIYGATSQRNLKARWDNAVNAHYQWFSPPAVLLKMWMNKTWTANLMDSDVVAKADAVGYNINCSACPGVSSNMQDCWWSDGSSFAPAKLLIWTHGNASSVAKGRYTFADQAGTTPVNGFILQGPIINAGRIRVVSWSGIGNPPRLYWHYSKWQTTNLPTDGSWHEIQDTHNIGTYAIGIIGNYGNTEPIGSLVIEVEGIPDPV